MTAKRTKRPAPPKRLRKRGRDYWRIVLDLYDLDEADQALLLAACEMLDRADSAREQVDKEGQTQVDRFGQVKPHPCIDIERQALMAFVRVRRELALDVTVLRTASCHVR